MTESPKTWYVYMVRCRDQSLYTGITNDPARRLGEHNSAKRGARYTRGRRPVSLVYLSPFPSRSAAARHEHIVKKMSLVKKRLLLQEKAGLDCTAEIYP
ncbi:MAG: GIY-YIG nuclease family protein [Desulfocapsaceae bacterium]|nr:GIY-YIG nuclease family protein [Desulfocapsaceae bacterium]